MALDEILSDTTISIISTTMAQHSMKASTCSANSIEQESLSKQLSVNVVQVELLKFLYYMTRSFMQLFFKWVTVTFHLISSKVLKFSNTSVQKNFEGKRKVIKYNVLLFISYIVLSYPYDKNNKWFLILIPLLKFKIGVSSYPVDMSLHSLFYIALPISKCIIAFPRHV